MRGSEVPQYEQLLSHDFVAPMLLSIVRDLNADGTAKAAAVP